MKRVLTIWLTLAIAVGMCFTFPSAGSAGDVFIIAHKSVPVSSITKGEIKKIFIGKMTRWPDDKKINFVTMDPGETHNKFLQNYIKRTPAQYNRYWKKQVFTGKGRKPKSFKTDKGVARYVASTEGAIGYVSDKNVANEVKVLSISAN